MTPRDLTPRQREFLRLCCSPLTYREMAERMEVSPRTIDGYRDLLFVKLGCANRATLVLWAVKNKLVKLKDIKI